MSLPKPTPSSAALVTGASAGIGSEIATLLAARGHNLVLVARRKQRLVALADELSEEHGVRVETIACDLGKTASRARIPGRIEELGLDVEILVNNAGFATGGAFYEADLDRELEQVRVLVEAVVVSHARVLTGDGRARARRDPERGLDGRNAADAVFRGLLGRQGVRPDLLRGASPGDARPRRDRHRARPRAGRDGLLGHRRLGDHERQVVRAGGARHADLVRARRPRRVEGLDSGERVVVPGLPMRVGMLASRYIPHALKLPALERFMRPSGGDK